LTNSVCIFNSRLNTAARAPTGCTDVSNNPALLSLLNNANPEQDPGNPSGIIECAGRFGGGPHRHADPNLKLPTSWRMAGTVEQTFDIPYLGKEFTASADVVYIKVQSPSCIKTCV